MAAKPIPETVRARIAKLMPMLSTTNENERLVVMGKILGILAENKLDIHDWTAGFAAGAGPGTSSSSGSDRGGFYYSAGQEQARRNQEYARQQRHRQEEANRRQAEEARRYSEDLKAQAQRQREAREEAVRRKREEEILRQAREDLADPPPPPPGIHTLKGVDTIQAIDLLFQSGIYLSDNAQDFLKSSRARAQGRTTITFSEKQFAWFGDLLRKAGLL